MKIDLGNFLLTLSWGLSVYGLVVGIWGALNKDKRFISSARTSVIICAVTSTASLFFLAVAFLQHSYRYLYVWQNSNNDMPSAYLISAIWGGMDGSLQLWAVLMSIFSAIATLRSGKISEEIKSWLSPVMSGATGFFITVVCFLTNPFRLIPEGINPADGNGLNPLLQNPSMLIHPPLLYLGFTGFVVPFAYCIAALCSGDLSSAWTKRVRRSTLIAWAFLTAGIILGGNWAYIELGWGGFWAWDPVENSSFMPWLAATAFLHSIMVQQHRGMLKVWTVVLCVLTYALCVFGTFLTRSGIVQSVHAFAETDVGWVFLLYLSILLVIAIILLTFRWSLLSPQNKIESYFSREVAFLFNNLVLIGICFSIFWGVMLPVFSEAITGEKIVVGPPFFNRVNVPLFLILLFLMAVGPAISWRRGNFSSFKRHFLRPLIFSSFVVVLFIYLDPSRIYAAISFGLCFLICITVISEFYRAVKAKKDTTASSTIGSLGNVVVSKPRKYGGMVVHLAVAIMTVAITASSAYKIERDVVLTPGDSASVGKYTLVLEKLSQSEQKNYFSLMADVGVYGMEGKKRITTLYPERRFYPRNEETTTEVDLRITLLDDLYIALAGYDGSSEKTNSTGLTGSATFKIFVNPLQVWLWFGALLMIFGAILVIIPASLEFREKQ
jgi:cytochrome c-type biogenesis protein CcmF